MIRTGRHFLQIPGPTNVPDRVLRAMDQPVIDHRGPEFAELGLAVLGGLRDIFQTSGHVIIYPSSGTGACEAALVNTLSPGDKVVIFETGQFSNHLAPNRGSAGPGCGLRAWKLAQGRLRRRPRRPAQRGQAACRQSGRGGSQRNLDRRNQPRTRGAEGNEPARPSRLADRGCDLLARVHGLQNGRMAG